VEGAVRLLGAFRRRHEKVRAEGGELDADLRANDDQTFDEVAEFANVAGPGVAKKNFQGAVGELASFFAVGGTELVQEMTGENRNVGGAVAQRRDEERNDVEAIEKILAETAVQNFLFEIFVGGGNDANIDADGLIGADRLEALLFEDAKNFGLGAKTHIADFIEEKCAAVGLGEFADFIVAGAGEAALDVAEEFGFDELFGMAAQLTSTKGPLLRKLAACSERATSSLPVPLSPKISTRPLVGAVTPICCAKLHGNAVADD